MYGFDNSIRYFKNSVGSYVLAGFYFRNISDSEGSKELKWQPDSDEIYGNSLNKIEGIEGTYVTAWQ